MEGVVDYHMRFILCTIGGIDMCTTEFVRVCSHVLPNKVFIRHCQELLREGERPAHVCDVPVRLQLLGSDPQALAFNAEKAVRLGAPGIDLNFGCPAKSVNKNRGGACLLNEPELLHKIVAEVRAKVPANIPVSVKIRLGYEDRNRYIENACAITAAGADELTVHARSKTDGYKPPAYWDCIGEIVQKVDIPIIANGEIWTVEDYLRCREQSGCENIMLGRGILARPDLALAIKAQQLRRPYFAMSWPHVASYILQLFRHTCDIYPQKTMGNRIKQWLFYLQREYQGAAQLFEEIKKLKDRTPIETAICKHAEDYLRVSNLGSATAVNLPPSKTIA